MARIYPYDLIFNDVSTADMNVSLISFGGVPHGEMKAKALDIPGRSGYLMTTDSALKPVTIRARMRLRAGASRREVSAWLSGQGELRWTKLPGYMWKATIQKGYEFSGFLPGADSLDEFTVQFLCQPYHYVYPPVSLTPANGATIVNAGTAEAEPLIVLTGSGDIALTIGENTLEISDLSGSVTIDTEARLAYDGDTNMTPYLSGDWPLIPTGTCVISWTGTVTSLAIQPNWRCV